MDNPHFDVNVHDTINSGQIFLWENYKDVWFVINGQNVIVMRQKKFLGMTMILKIL